MILVTVGTHDQQFNRLVRFMDEWAGEHDEPVVIQSGCSTVEPHHCEWKDYYPYQTMQRYMEEARIVITHGGPSSFVTPLQFNKIPIDNFFPWPVSCYSWSVAALCSSQCV